MFSRNAFQSANKGIRSFSTSHSLHRLKIGYVPEHFSAPLIFAQKHFGLDADLEPVPHGTGALASRLKAYRDESQIDVGIGLTEGFVADLGKTKAAGYNAGYGLVGTYVESPLCWAISTGKGRDDIKSLGDLKGKKVGVSRINSGSHVMSYVLADQNGWLNSSGEDPFEVTPIGDFRALRTSVIEKKADFFMWEHFTTSRYWQNGELKRIGEIYTPWPSWMIAARNAADEQLEDMAQKINKGILYFQEQPEEALKYITTNLEYSPRDAKEWRKTVRFSDNVRGVDPGVVDSAVHILRKAGVINEKAGGSEHMVSIKRAAQGST